MCGFVGGTNGDWDYQGAVESIQHRGPDSQDVSVVDGVTLGFARLAVIDVRQVADQPMTTHDEQVRLVYNGEIYGFDKLRSELESRGYTFRTRSDTEVVLQAYICWGDAFVDRIDGMFAICIHDRRSHELKLYRDPAGIKPLYYYWDGRDFGCASELKALEAATHRASLSYDYTAVFDFLTYGYVPAPKSLYKNVFKLPPAHRVTLNLASGRLDAPHRYWEVPVAAQPHADISVEEAAAETRSLVDSAVREQLVADVPVGCFLSGGVDSSAVVASAAAATASLRTYTIGFDDAEHSEVTFARQVAEHFSTQHCERIFRPTEAPADLAQLKRWYDEPFADTSAFPTFLVSQVARQSVTVALSGDGGDELFGGYRWYRQFRRLKRLAGLLPRSLAGPLAKRKRRYRPRSIARRAMTLGHVLATSEMGLYAMMMSGMTREEKRAYAEAWEIPADYDDYWHFRIHWRADLPLLTRLQYLDFHTYLPGDILTKVDRVSMANSLEVRVPLLSRRVIEFAFSLPEDVRLDNDEPKALLKQAYRQALPAEILNRPKRGFSLPPELRTVSSQSAAEAVLDAAFPQFRLEQPVATSARGPTVAAQSESAAK